MTEYSRLNAALAERYTVERELGAGGMATVYLAHDIKHDRKVAVKVLRPELAAVIGAERFLAEIKTTANLQHPHILPLFDSGVAGGHPDPERIVGEGSAPSFLYYVMPFVEGISLRDRMSREKQLPISEAVRITSEIAAALDYAHRHNVIHRDIKPENILLHDGSALVADFGIALAASKAGTRMTETGMSLGTPSYMSPEQAMGERDLDARSDVYALGCVAYEMLTGEPPFSGPTAQAIVAKVMTSEPVTATSLRKTIPPHVSDAVHTALEKLPADRFATAAEFAAALANPGAATRATHVGVAKNRRRQIGPMTIGALAVITLVAGLAIGRSTARTQSGLSDVIAATLDMGDSGKVRPIGNLRLAISRQGDRVVFVGNSGPDAVLWVRELDQPAARMLADTRGAMAPFFSPDGQSIGYFASLGGSTALKVVPVNGGVTRTLVQDSVAAFGGGSWGDDGNIYFTTNVRALGRVSSNGGSITTIARPDTAKGYKEIDYPTVLPGSKQALLMLWFGSVTSNKIGLVDLATGEISIIADGSFPRFLAPNRVLIGTTNGNVLVGQLDARHHRLTDQPVAVVQGVQDETSNGTLQFGVADNGTLIYEKKVGGNVGVVWVDRAGALSKVDSGFNGNFVSPSLSPDGNAIAVSVNTPSGTQVWVKQLATGAFTQLSGDIKDADRPTWTPDGRNIAFLGVTSAAQRRTAWIRRADGSDKVQPLLGKVLPLDELQFEKSGRYMIFRSEGAGQGTRHLLIAERGVDSVPRTLIKEKYDTYAPVISPDGHWLAYVSEESGTKEVYVRPFPHVDSAKFAVSVNGGLEPLWRRDGAELFFRNQRGEMFAVPVTTGATFQHGVPKLLFSRPGLTLQDYYRDYDVSLDGKRFLMLDGGGGETSALNVIFNWGKQLERVVKGGTR